MKKRIKLLSLCIICILIFSQTLLVSALTEINNETSYPITTPYEYPIKPGTNEWINFKTHAEKVEACQIPQEILCKMSTEALVETILNYPLLIDMFAWNTFEDGYFMLSKTFNGIKELEYRNDSVYIVNNYKETKSFFGRESSSINNNELILKPLYLDIINCGLINSRLVNKAPNDSVGSYATYRYVYTPKGTAVAATYDTMWSDIRETEAQLQAAQNDVPKTYPSATLLRPYNIKYNCHSYAWYSTSSANKYWIDDPISYMTDGSYIKSNLAVGAKVFYDSALGDKYDHSGIVTGYNYPIGGGVFVDSKWGKLGLYNHNLGDCPYQSYQPTCTFWK